MRIFADRRKKAAIIVDDPSAICMPIDDGLRSVHECHRKIWHNLSGLRILDTVLLLASRTPTGLRETAQG